MIDLSNVRDTNIYCEVPMHYYECWFVRLNRAGACFQQRIIQIAIQM